MPKAALLKQFLKNCTGFDTVVNKIKFISANNGNALASLVLKKEHLNVLGTLHGGVSSTLVDVVSSYGLMTHPEGERASVSVNITMMFEKAAKEGDEILIDSKILRIGRNLAFLTVDIKNKTNGDILVQGSHTKFLMSY